MVEELKSDVRSWMRVGAVWRFYEAEPDGDRIVLYEPGSDAPVQFFTFERQQKPGGLCLADFVLPPRDGVRDSMALFVVGAGEGVRARSEAAKDAGEYLASHAIQALAIETAEAAAEWLHAQLRGAVGFPGPARDDDEGPVCRPLPRQALQLRLSGVPRSRRPGAACGGCCDPRTSASSSPTA